MKPDDNRIALQLNQRPGKTLGFMTPADKLNASKGCCIHRLNPSQRTSCVFRMKVTDRFGIVTGDFGNVTGRFGNVTGRTGQQDWRCA